MRVAKNAVAATEQDDTLSRPGQIGQHLAIFLVHDLGPDWNLQDEVVAFGAGLFAPRPGPAVRSPEMLTIAKVDQGIQIVHRDKDDVAALAAVTAIGPAELDEFLAAKAGGTTPTVTALQIDLALVEKLHGMMPSGRKKGERRGRSPFLFGLSGNGYSAASAGGFGAGAVDGEGGTTET